MAQILLVTDDDEIAGVLSKFVLKAGYEVTLARDYNSAMACVQSESIQLVLLDTLWNGDFSSIDLANALSSFDATLPMIMLDIHDERHSRLIPRINISFMGRHLDIEEVMLRIHRSLNP